MVWMLMTAALSDAIWTLMGGKQHRCWRSEESSSSGCRVTDKVCVLVGMKEYLWIMIPCGDGRIFQLCSMIPGEDSWWGWNNIRGF
jgi:hypothetical protein